jgi:hypothetical protein
MAKVTITLTLEQAREVKDTLGEILDMRTSVLKDQGMRAEHSRRGGEGIAEWKNLQNRTATLEAALRELS